MIKRLIRPLFKSPVAVLTISAASVGIVFFSIQFQATLQQEVGAAKKHLTKWNKSLVDNSFYNVNKTELNRTLEDLNNHSINYYRMDTSKEENFIASSSETLTCDNEQVKRLSLPGGIYAGEVKFCVSNFKVAKKSVLSWPIIACLIFIIFILGLSTFTPILAYKSHLEMILEYLEHMRESPEKRSKFLKSTDSTINNLILLITQKISKEIEANKLVSQMEVENQHSKLVSLAGHDLKNSVDVLKKKFRLCVGHLPEEELAPLYKSLSKIESICEDIRDKDRANAYKINQLVFLEVKSPVTTVVEELRTIFPRVKFTLDIEEGLKAKASELDFERVLSNVIRNACEVIWKKKSAHIDITAKKNGHTALITVSDNGPGIPEDIQEMIFDQNFTFGKEQGTGLGLSYVKSRVKDWDGAISFTTGKAGTTFRLELKTQIIKLTNEQDGKENEAKNTHSNIISL